VGRDAARLYGHVAPPLMMVIHRMKSHSSSQAGRTIGAELDEPVAHLEPLPRQAGALFAIGLG